MKRRRTDNATRGIGQRVSGQVTAWGADARLEIALIEEGELTLPPTDHPWDSFRRRSKLRMRKAMLWDAVKMRRWALLRRWLRRVLTLGLWGR